MSFHGPKRTARASSRVSPCSMVSLRMGSFSASPRCAGRTLKESPPSPFGRATFTMAAVVASRSVKQIVSSETVPAGIWPGRRAMNGTRCPPSNGVPLPSCQGPLVTGPKVRASCLAVLNFSRTPPASLARLNFTAAGICFLREAPETAIGPDRRAGKGGARNSHGGSPPRRRSGRLFSPENRPERAVRAAPALSANSPAGCAGGTPPLIRPSPLPWVAVPRSPGMPNQWLRQRRKASLGGRFLSQGTDTHPLPIFQPPRPAPGVDPPTER